jgi:hypothetical protein
MKRIILALALLSVASRGQASVETILPISTFRIESEGVNRSGKIVVEGNWDKNHRMVALKVTAFGKEYVVPKEKLAQFRGLPANGVRLSYEGGRGLANGGRTVYVQFQAGWVGIRRGSTLQHGYIAVQENGDVRVEAGDW